MTTDANRPIGNEPAVASAAFPLTWFHAGGLGLSLIVLGLGIWFAVSFGQWGVLAAGCAAVVLAVVSWPVSLGVARLRQDAARQQAEMLGMFRERLQQISIVLDMLSEQQLLSDGAKAVAFREKDRDALRRAIHEEISRQDWEAALVLANSMEQQFGYRQEAERFREQINDKHREAIHRQIAEAVVVVDRYTRAEQWNQALREAERLGGIFPEDAQVRQLPQEIEARRQGHKKRLLDSWNDAVGRHDVDGSIEILKQLDLYLTPTEADAMQETARGIFKEKLENLRTDFAAAVKDHRWPEAVRVGDEIARDFPNSRIAQEVREKMDTLRQRAAEPAAAGV